MYYIEYIFGLTEITDECHFETKEECTRYLIEEGYSKCNYFNSDFTFYKEMVFSDGSSTDVYAGIFKMNEYNN